MKAKLTFLAGLAAGYVLGTRAGRTSYEKIKTSAKSLWHTDVVQNNVDTVKHDIKEHVEEVAHQLLPSYKRDRVLDDSRPGGVKADSEATGANPLDIVSEASDEFPDSALSGSEEEQVESRWDLPETRS